MANANATAILNDEVLIDRKSAPQGGEVHEATKNVQPSNDDRHVDCDVLVIGAGFSGITAIHRFRKLGMKVKCFESGDNFGGVWYWNRVSQTIANRGNTVLTAAVPWRSRGQRSPILPAQYSRSIPTLALQGEIP